KIAEENREKAREAFQGDREGAFARMREIAQEADKKVADVLEEEQAKRLEEIRLQVSGPAAVASPEVAEKLNISQEQRRQIGELLRSQGEKTREAFSNAEGEGAERFAAARPKL